MGLSNQFTGTRGQILLINPSPSLNQPYSMLLQEEHQIDTSNTSFITAKNTAMSVKHQNYQRNVKRFTKKSLHVSVVPSMDQTNLN